MPFPAVHITVIALAAGTGGLFAQRIRRAARVMCAAAGAKNAYAEIYLVGDAMMEKNVLAFPADPRFPRPDIPGKVLGEMYLNPGYIKKHGQNLAHMLSHGLLHLLGYTHERARDTMRMERMEKMLCAKVVHIFET